MKQMENYDRKKIIQILSKDVFVDKLANPIEALADYLIDNGVTFKTKEIITNFDRIKSMSVEEMAEMLIEETEAPLSGEPFLRTPDGELFSEYEEQAKNKAILHTIQWLLQEESDE